MNHPIQHRRGPALVLVAALAAAALAGRMRRILGRLEHRRHRCGVAARRRRQHPARARRLLDAEEGLRRPHHRVRARPAGRKGVSFSQSFGASGSQSRAVDSGQSADVVAFSTTPDVTRLVKDGIVSSSWDANPHKGFSSDSVVVLVVRKGNPKHITGWDDLVKPGVDVITPNPSTSGSARWNILAGYGAQLKEGKTPAQALAYVKTLLTKNVSVQDSSASAALQTFTGGKGDVLLDYESDAIAAAEGR